MKGKLLTAMLFLCITAVLPAQKQQTLAGKGALKGNGFKGGFGGVYLLLSEAAGDAGGGAGVEGAFIINDFFIGGYFQTETFGRRRIGGRDYELAYAGSGVSAGYAFPSYKAIHFFTSVRMGPVYGFLNRKGDDPFDSNDYNDTAFMMSPEFGVEFNITNWLRLAGTAGFRYMAGVDGLPGISSSSFNRPFLGITARMGRLGQK